MCSVMGSSREERQEYGRENPFFGFSDSEKPNFVVSGKCCPRGGIVVCGRGMLGRRGSHSRRRCCVVCG